MRSWASVFFESGKELPPQAGGGKRKISREKAAF
jgi:hypothetical protein